MAVTYNLKGTTNSSFQIGKKGVVLTPADNTSATTVTFPNATGTLVLQDSTDTLTNKTLSLTNNTLTGTTAEFNSALSDGSFATLAGTETLTNKTLGATTISGHLTPSANVTYDLGTSAYRFRDIYLSGTTIDLGGAKLTNDGSDNLDIKDSSGNRKIIRASAIELVDSNGKKMKLERDATSGKLKQTRKNSDGTDEGSSDTLDIVGDTSPQLGGDLDTNGNNITFGDNDIAYFGTGNDLSIYHSGTQSWIKDVNGSSPLILASDQEVQIRNSTGSEYKARFITNGAVELYYDNSKKLETTSTGVSVTGDGAFSGNVTVTGNLTVNGTTTTVNSTEVNVQNAFVFEGTTADDYETTLTVTDPTADRTITLPDATGTVVLADATQTLTNKTLTSPVIDTVTRTGDFTVDASNDIILDADNSILLKDGGTQYGNFQMTASAFAIKSDVMDKRIDIKGNDGGVEVTAVSFHFANAGQATFNVNPSVPTGIIFEGATDDANETTLTVTDPTADRTITLPDATGTVVLADTTDTLSNKSFSGNVAFDTDVLFVDATNNRVGVNTSSPADPFVVKQGIGETRFGGTNGRTLSAYQSGSLSNFDFKANQVYFEADLLINGAKKISTHNGSTQNLYITTSDATKAIYTDRDIITDGDLIFEGATANDYETTLTVTDPTADRTITLPDATGTLLLDSSTFGYPKDFGSITGSTSTFPVGTAPDFGALTGEVLIGQDFGIIDSYISLTTLKSVVSASTDFADFKTRIAGL